MDALGELTLAEVAQSGFIHEYDTSGTGNTLPPTFPLTNSARGTTSPYYASYQEVPLLFRRNSCGPRYARLEGYRNPKGGD